MLGLVRLAGIGAYLHAATAFGAAMNFDFRDPDTNELQLAVHESVTQESDLTVREARYLWPSGDVAATERYEAKAGRIESYAFSDPSTGEMISVKRESADKLAVSYRDDKGSKIESKVLDDSATAIHGKALPELILRHWADLALGETVDFDLIVPQRQQLIGFRARRDVGASRKSGRPTIIVEASNWMIRQFAPDMTFVFDGDKSRALVEFVGPSAVEIKGKRHRTVRMTSSEAPAER